MPATGIDEAVKGGVPIETSRRTVAVLGLAFLALLVPDAVAAYGGPGSVISGLGALLAALAAVGAAIFGFFWFPLKRLYRRIRGEKEEEDVAGAS